MMESNLEIKEIMRLLHPLSIKSKLEIIENLTNELMRDIYNDGQEKTKLLNELFGVWKEMDENLIHEIMDS